MMEDTENSASALSGFSVMRKRSSILRRPRDVKGSLPSYTFLPPSTHANVALSGDGFSGPVNENTLKLKLKLGGVTRTFQTSSDVDNIYKDGFTNQHQASKPRYKSEFQDNEQNSLSDKVKGNGIQQRHVQKTLYLGEYSPETRKRGPKKRVLEEELDSDDGDEEIKYLKRLKSKRLSKDYSNSHDMEGEEHFPLDNLVAERKKPRMGIADSLPTTRTRALQSGNNAYSVIGSCPLEYPDGLPCAASKRQKPKLSEVEQQSKKAEAAQRRRMQSEKAAQEAEAEAIRKILGQDSGRKKKEDKIKKQQEERAQERAARSRTLSSNTVRLIIGPSGTTVTFSEDIGLPDIFKPITSSYPPPREKCVGPNCEKAYKYRDSKSKLPLCSLSCYKAIQEKMQPLIRC